MRGERRAEDAEVGVVFELAQHIEHMGGVFADILVADIAEAGTHAAGLGLDGLFVVHEAGVVIPAQLRGQIAEERTDIAAAVFHHRDGDAVQRQGGKGFFDLGLFAGLVR